MWKEYPHLCSVSNKIEIEHIFNFYFIRNKKTNSYFYILDGGKRNIDISIPGAEAPDSSKCSNVSPVSGINTRR
jgi:hypothetical protein